MRFDFQLATANVLSGTAAGLSLVPQTETAFGNSYYNAAGVLSTVNTKNASILNANNANTATTGYTTAILDNLLSASDHLPLGADYVIAVPEPGTAAVVVVAFGMAGRRRRA